MSINDVFSQPEKPTPWAPAIFILSIVFLIPGMLVAIAWIVTVSVLGILASGVSFWPVFGLTACLWVVASWFGKKK